MAVALSLGAGVGAVVVSAGPQIRGRGAQQRCSYGVSCSFRTRAAATLRIAAAAERRKAFVVVKAAGEGVETEVEAEAVGGVLPADQWPDTFGFLNYEDLHAHYEPILFKAEAQPGTYLADVMSKTLYTASPEQSLAEVEHYFKEISGVPVVDGEFKVIGVLSRKDISRAIDEGMSKVKEVMTAPAITLSADKSVQDAAVLMLKNKIHRIPIVNSGGHVVGIVTRTDIFTALDTAPNST